MSDVDDHRDRGADLDGASSALADSSSGVTAAAVARLQHSVAEAHNPPCPPAIGQSARSTIVQCSGDATEGGCTAPEAALNRPAATTACDALLGDCGYPDDASTAAAVSPRAAVAAARRIASRAHFSGLLYHHHFPGAAGSRTKRKVLCCAASLSSPDSLAHDGIGGGKIRVSEERVSRQLQQLRLAGSGNIDCSGGGGGVPQTPVASTSAGAAPAEATPLCEALPLIARGSPRSSDRRPSGSMTLSLHRRLAKHRLHDGRRGPLRDSLLAARRASCPGLSPSALAACPASAGASTIDGRLSPDDGGWLQTARTAALTDEMDAAASCRTILSPPLVVWQSDEKPTDSAPAVDAVEPPHRTSHEHKTLTLAAPSAVFRDRAVRGSPLHLSAERAKLPTLQVPVNEVERSSSPPPSALINPDEEGVCVVLSVAHCDAPAEADNRPTLTDAADQCMEL